MRTRGPCLCAGISCSTTNLSGVNHRQQFRPVQARSGCIARCEIGLVTTCSRVIHRLQFRRQILVQTLDLRRAKQRASHASTVGSAGVLGRIIAEDVTIGKCRPPRRRSFRWQFWLCDESRSGEGHIRDPRKSLLRPLVRRYGTGFRPQDSADRPTHFRPLSARFAVVRSLKTPHKRGALQ